MNIIFDRVLINNFLSIGNAEVQLSERGFVLVNGRNHSSEITQSNGSGKSAIFDSIFWCLTGETSRGTSDVVNEFKKSEGCLVSVEFRSEDNSYKVIRTKNHKEYGNTCIVYLNEECVSDQTKKSQEYLSKVVPDLSSEILGSVILLGQGLPYRFSSLSPIKRKELLETMSSSSQDIEGIKFKLDQKLGNLSTDLNTLKSENLKYDGTITGLESTIVTLNSQLSRQKSKEDIDKETNLINSKINEIEESLKEYNSQKNLLEQDKTKIRQNSQKILEQVIQYKTVYQSVMNNLSSIKDGKCPTCGREYEISQETVTRKSLLEEKKGKLLEVIKEFEVKNQELISNEKKVDNDIFTLTSKISSSTAEISRLSQQIKSLNDLNESQSVIESQVKDTQNQIDSLKIKIHDNSSKIVSLEEEIECINYLLRQLSRDFKGYVLQETIDFLSERTEYYSKYLFNGKSLVKVTLSGTKVLITLNERPYENLSGGERQRVDLAVQFALRDVMLTSSGFTCNILVLDEVFDNLDETGCSSLISLVISELSDIDSVFTITHHSEIDIPYDSQITVVKNPDGVSDVR